MVGHELFVSGRTMARAGSPSASVRVTLAPHLPDRGRHLGRIEVTAFGIISCAYETSRPAVDLRALGRPRAAISEHIDTLEGQFGPYPTTTQTFALRYLIGARAIGSELTAGSSDDPYRSTSRCPKLPRCAQPLSPQVSTPALASRTGPEDQLWCHLDAVRATATITAGQDPQNWGYRRKASPDQEGIETVPGGFRTKIIPRRKASPDYRSRAGVGRLEAATLLWCGPGQRQIHYL